METRSIDRDSMTEMFRRAAIVAIAVSLALAAQVDLPQKPMLNLAGIKTMVAAAEAEAAKRNVQVTLCITDEQGNILFLQKADAAGTSTIMYASRKAKHAALYRQPSKAGADRLKGGDLSVLALPDYFPNQGGLPIRYKGVVIGAIAASGAPSEVDEAIAQAGIDALVK
jgi:glc operon protein GlcG